MPIRHAFEKWLPENIEAATNHPSPGPRPPEPPRPNGYNLHILTHGCEPDEEQVERLWAKDLPHTPYDDLEFASNEWVRAYDEVRERMRAERKSEMDHPLSREEHARRVAKYNEQYQREQANLALRQRERKIGDAVKAVGDRFKERCRNLSRNSLPNPAGGTLTFPECRSRMAR